jgi:hypothetical protein
MISEIVLFKEAEAPTVESLRIEISSSFEKSAHDSTLLYTPSQSRKGRQGLTISDAHFDEKKIYKANSASQPVVRYLESQT